MRNALYEFRPSFTSKVEQQSISARRYFLFRRAGPIGRSITQAKKKGEIAGRKNYFLIGGCAESGSHHSLTALPQ